LAIYSPISKLNTNLGHDAKEPQYYFKKTRDVSRIMLAKHSTYHVHHVTIPKFATAFDFKLKDIPKM